jgi:hypothetical protein
MLQTATKKKYQRPWKRFTFSNDYLMYIHDKKRNSFEVYSGSSGGNTPYAYHRRLTREQFIREVFDTRKALRGEATSTTE